MIGGQTMDATAMRGRHSRRAELERQECRADLSQWMTPPALARWIVEHHAPRDSSDLTVLEPSCGKGAFVDALIDYGIEPHAIDIDPRFDPSGESNDFLDLETYELNWIVGNPPYEKGLDARFVAHALSLAPRVTMLLRASVLHTGRFQSALAGTRSRITRIDALGRVRFDGPTTGTGSPRHDFAAVTMCRYSRGHDPCVPATWRYVPRADWEAAQ